MPPKTKKLVRKSEPPKPLLYVQWIHIAKPDRCAHCMEPIKVPAFGYIEPESKSMYYDTCKPPGNWSIK